MREGCKYQWERVLELLKAGGSISALSALPLFGTMSLSRHIFKLRQKGYDICKREVVNGSLRYSEYFLRREA